MPGSVATFGTLAVGWEPRPGRRSVGVKRATFVHGLTAIVRLAPMAHMAAKKPPKKATPAKKALPLQRSPRPRRTPRQRRRSRRPHLRTSQRRRSPAPPRAGTRGAEGSSTRSSRQRPRRERRDRRACPGRARPCRGAREAPVLRRMLTAPAVPHPLACLRRLLAWAHVSLVRRRSLAPSSSRARSRSSFAIIPENAEL